MTGVTDGNLGAHIAAFEAANYVLALRDFKDKRPRTRMGMTVAGKAAFDSYKAYLRTLLGS